LICRQMMKTQQSQSCNSILYHFNLCKKDTLKIKKVSHKRKIQQYQQLPLDSRKNKLLINELEHTNKLQIEKVLHL
jgi:hypothetical protein